MTEMFMVGLGLIDVIVFKCGMEESEGHIFALIKANSIA